MNRVYAQYKDKPKAVAWYNITPTLASQFETVYNNIRYTYSVDESTGNALDVIGNVVDIARIDATDEIYKILLRAKISKNNSDATLDSIFTAVQYVTGIQDIRVNDYENMTFTVEFANPLTTEQRDIFNEYDLVPKPQGVDFLGFVEFLPIIESRPYAAAANTEILVGDTFYFGNITSESDTNTFVGCGTDTVVILESLSA
jgi:hypothetical protein